MTGIKYLLKHESTVIEGINYADYEDKIKEASERCPVEVTKDSE